MALTISLKSDYQQAMRKLRNQLGHRAPRAAVSGLNRTARYALTASIRAVQKDIGATSQKSIRRNVHAIRATPQKLEAEIEARSTKKERIPIFEIRPKPRGLTKRRPAGGVRYGPQSKLIPGSFIGRMQSGHVGVFKRAGAARLPIAELFGPSVALVLSRKRVYEQVRKVIAERLPREIQRAFKFATG